MAPSESDKPRLSPTDERRLARLEALFTVDQATSKRVEKRLDNIEALVQGLVVSFNTAKASGRILIGAAAAVGSVVTVVVTWLVQAKA